MKEAQTTTTCLLGRHCAAALQRWVCAMFGVAETPGARSSNSDGIPRTISVSSIASSDYGSTEALIKADATEKKPSNVDTVVAAGFIKVQLVFSATELEAMYYELKNVPRVPFDLNYIKTNIVEKQLGTSMDLEYFDGFSWEPLTKMSALAKHKRLAKFNGMTVVPLRVPLHYVGDDDIDGVRFSRR